MYVKMQEKSISIEKCYNLTINLPSPGETVLREVLCTAPAALT